ncbi:MAG: helix-turn-helix domain-containing protein [Lachnospiraceae bacterium]|nr:helix-turn-helix domain-containing protein [Lachnospiraceae bacterium]MDY5742251.1 helix-turn-helix domain-containing protein [Lachnospiraceae bacterium]
MLIGSTPSRLEILLCIGDRFSQGKAVSVTLVATHIGISKSTVSRTIDSLREEGIVEADGLTLTRYGKRVVCLLRKGRALFIDSLTKYGKLSREDALRQALIWMSSMEEKLLENFVCASEKEKRYHFFQEYASFSNCNIIGMLPAGRYPIGFTIFRRNPQKGQLLGQVSMANGGFKHPAYLEIGPTANDLVLESRPILVKLPGHLGNLRGIVSDLEYQVGTQAKKAVKEGFSWRLPLTDLRFTYNEGEKVMVAIVEVKLTSRAGIAFMPPSQAIMMLHAETGGCSERW